MPVFSLTITPWLFAAAKESKAVASSASAPLAPPTTVLSLTLFCVAVASALVEIPDFVDTTTEDGCSQWRNER